MSPTFHAGEIEIQRRAGVREAGERVGRGIVAGLPEGIDEVLGRQRLAVAASVDAAGRVHASVLDGAEGFLERIDDELLRVGGALPPESRLARDLADNPELGLLVFDPTRRRRLRVNGRALALPAGILLRVRQFYGNCSKYIQLRRLTGEAESFPAAESHVAAQLSAEQARTIAAADTFFLASFHPEGGADASHRGGRPGFVRVPGPERIVFSDYAGNNMFNTLGNLVVHPRVALLFLDFATGDALQVEGRARVARDRTVEVAVNAVAETRGASRWRYELVEASPFNPPLSRSTAGSISKGERDTTPERRPA